MQFLSKAAQALYAQRGYSQTITGTGRGGKVSVDDVRKHSESLTSTIMQSAVWDDNVYFKDATPEEASVNEDFKFRLQPRKASKLTPEAIQFAEHVATVRGLSIGYCIDYALSKNITSVDAARKSGIDWLEAIANHYQA